MFKRDVLVRVVLEELGFAFHIFTVHILLFFREVPNVLRRERARERGRWDQKKRVSDT
jgi:hypothetical protein